MFVRREHQLAAHNDDAASPKFGVRRETYVQQTASSHLHALFDEEPQSDGGIEETRVRGLRGVGIKRINIAPLSARTAQYVEA